MGADSPWRRFRRRFRYWLNHSERQRSLWEEMEFHIESMAEDLMAQGTSEDEARATAHRKFGNMTRKSEEARSTWIARWISDLAQDLRHSFRGMRRDAGFTVFTILIAGLGIGASSTVFSVVNALLLRPLPFRNAEELIWISNGGWNGEEWSTQVSHFLDLKALNRSFVDMAAYYARIQKGRQAAYRNRRARTFDRCSGDTELPSDAGHRSHDRPVFRAGRMHRPKRCSPRRDSQLRILAKTICLRPIHSGKETDYR